MKAIVVREFGAPEVMRLEEAPDPAPGPGQVRVRVMAAGVNPVDAYIRTGTHARKPELPYTPGFDYAGVIDQVGRDVTTLTAGARVWGHEVAPGSGAYAAFAIATEADVVPLPDGTTFQQGAALGIPYVTAWRAMLIRARATAGETVLIHGASGGVGVAAVQIARARGMRVMGTAGSDKGLSLVREQGAHDVLDHRQPDYLSQVMSMTDGRGVDVVVEMLANVNLDRDLDVLARNGRISLVGNRGRVDIDPRKIMARDATVVGTLVFNTERAELNDIHAGIVSGLEDGSLRPVVGRELALSEAASAHRLVMESGATGKIVLVP